MAWWKYAAISVTCAAGLAHASPAAAQDMPEEYRTVLTALGKTGDFKEGVLKVNIPRNDLTIGRPDIDVRAHGARITARMGLNTWAAFTGTDADAMVAGDVAMLANEVTPVLSALRAQGISIVAIHHHMTDVSPNVIFLHYFGTGSAAKLAQAVRAALDVLGKTSGGARTRPAH